MSARVELVKGRGGLHRQFYYRLVAANGQVVTVSETYWSKSNAKRAARREAIRLLLPVVEVDASEES